MNYPSVTKTTWKEKLRLFFVRPKIIVRNTKYHDWLLVFKELKGKVYITKSQNLAKSRHKLRESVDKSYAKKPIFFITPGSTGTVAFAVAKSDSGEDLIFLTEQTYTSWALKNLK